MGWLGRLLGKEPPKVPEGSRAYASMDDLDGTAWSVRVVMDGGATTWRDKRISPTFKRQTTAYEYLAWVNGEAQSFTYPEGEA